MRFSILAKIGFLIAAVLVATMATVLWNTNRVFYEDKQAFVNELSSKLSQGVSQVVQERLSGIRSQLAIFISNYESLNSNQRKDPQLNPVLFAQYEDYFSLSALRASDRKLRWRVNNEKLTADWPIGFDEQVLASLNLPNANKQSLYFQSLSLADSSPAIAVIFSAQLQNEAIKEGETLEDVILIALAKPEIFQVAVANYKASLNTAFLVDKTGFVIAHPDESLLGSSLVQHSVVQEIFQNNKQAGVGDSYKDRSGNLIAASYENVVGSNLYVVVTTPRQEAFRAANELFKSLIVIGLGVLIVGMVLSVIFTQLLTSPLKNLKRVAAEIGDGNFDVKVPVKSKDEVGDLAQSIQQMATSLIERDQALESSKNALVQSEKMSAFGQLSAGIAHEVKNPLAGILGHAQLAKAKVKDEGIKKHIEVIESETRRTKEIIENLMRFARAEKMDLSPTNMWDTVQAAVDLVDHQLSLMNVKIFRDIEIVPAVRANSNQIQQVLLNLMMNAGHAMEERDTKELHVSLKYVPEEKLVRIQIRDTGHGMSEEVKKKIFEPFFTTKPAGKGTGLGLSVTIGIVKDHNAKIYVESEENVGTSFFIDFDEAEDCQLPTATYEPKFHEEAPVSSSQAKESESLTASGPSNENSSEIPSAPDFASNASVEEDYDDEEPTGITSIEEVLRMDEDVEESHVSSSVAETRSQGFGIEEEDDEDFQVHTAQGIPQGLPSSPEEVEVPVVPPSGSSEEPEEDEDVYSAADALAGFSLNDEIDLEEKTVIGEIPEMPSAEEKNEADSEDSNSEKDDEFRVKIRKPKIKR